jgi:hypothetical protein
MDAASPGAGFPAADEAALIVPWVVVDTLNWLSVEGRYIPDPACRYILFGNFLNADEVETVEINPAGNVDCAHVLRANSSDDRDPRVLAEGQRETGGLQ